MSETTGAAWGVDGCKAGWFYFRLSPAGHITFGVVTKLRELLRRGEVHEEESPGQHFVHDNDLLLVDIPIGLPEGDRKGPKCVSRDCDRTARAQLGPRHGSVFPVPVRHAMDEFEKHFLNLRESHNEADALKAAARLVRPIPPVTAGIFPKVFEVDQLMQTDSRSSKLILETHPEVCFWAMKDALKDEFKSACMDFPKTHGVGFLDRLAVLGSVYSKADDEVLGACRKHRSIGSDDIVDAMACAVTARLILDEPGSNRSLGDDPPEDEKGLPMQIVLASRDAVQRARAAATASGAP